MIAPVEVLKKSEIVWLKKNRCRHHHPYLEHYACFNKEKHGGFEKIGILDIEASNLKADFGFVFSYCIKELNGDIIYRVLVPEEIRSGTYDKNLIRQFCKDIGNYDRIITYRS